MYVHALLDIVHTLLIDVHAVLSIVIALLCKKYVLTIIVEIARVLLKVMVY